MKPLRRLVWSKSEIDLDDPFQRQWYIRQVLTNGRAQDIAGLDWMEIKSLLPQLNLPCEIARLWEWVFAA